MGRDRTFAPERLPHADTFPGQDWGPELIYIGLWFTVRDTA